jgi:hypothetical protein
VSLPSFRQFVQRAAVGAGVAHAQSALRAVHGRGAARWLAGHAGISPRTARRWISGAYPRGRAAEIREAALAAGTFATAAARFCGITHISVGTIEVFYDGEGQGTRGIGELDVDAEMAGYLTRSATDLENGDLEGAEEAFSNAIINGYESGLEDVLYIEDWDGIEIQP